MATHSSILAWRIPWTEESGRLVDGVAKNLTQLGIFHSLTPFFLVVFFEAQSTEICGHHPPV